jgi:hypothetical protein
MRIIPIRPLKVTENTATGSIVAIGLTISLIPLALVILLFALVYPGLQTDSQIAKNAVKTVQAEAHGDVVSTVVLSTADLPIDYIVQGGKFKSRRWAFVFGEFHHEKPLQVFYLKGQPEIGTTNWAIDALPLRWGTFWAFAIIFAFGVLLVWALTRKVSAERLLSRRRSRPLFCRAIKQKTTGIGITPGSYQTAKPGRIWSPGHRTENRTSRRQRRTAHWPSYAGTVWPTWLMSKAGRSISASPN